MNSKPYFKANLITTNAAGEYYGIRSFKYLTASPDNIQIGQTIIPYGRLIEISSESDRVFIQFFDETGKSCEFYFKYNTFLPSSARTRLKALVKTANALIPLKPRNRNPRPGIMAAAGPTPDGRHEVIVYSSKVSFPPKCPVCFVPASKVAKFEVTSVVPSSDLLKFGHWLIPVCHSHKNLSGEVQVKNWSPKSSQLGFVFKNEKYAHAFVELNEAPPGSRSPVEPIVLEKISKLRNFKFVLYEYYVSLVFFSFLGLSDIHELRKDQNQFVKGLKYNAVTMVSGWWNIPFGPFFTVIVLLRNLKGGSDVSDRVLAVFAGKPFSATRD